MRIGIDARFFGPLGKGLGRYTQKLAENLEKISAKGGSASGGDSEDVFFVFLRRENFDDYQPQNPKFKKVLADYRWYTFSEQINMPLLLNKYDLDLVHFPHFNVPLLYRKKFVITIHDLILIHFPTVKNTTLNPLFYWFKFAAYKIVIRSAIKRAQKVITVSNFTKRDILGHYKIPENKIAMTYEACDLPSGNASGDGKAILEKYGIIKPYILYVGNAYPHKNLEALILAFEKIVIQKSDLRLVLVGKEDFFYQRLKKLTDDKKIKGVIFTGFVPDEDLDAVYREAELYVFPSLYEGFGIPPLEAMSAGVPVVSSDNPCLREILGKAAHYFDAGKIESIAEAIMKGVDDFHMREDLVKKGYERVKKYSWERMARETLEIYQEN